MKTKSLLVVFIIIAGIASLASAADTLLNVSYDPTRELYDEVSAVFSKHWKGKTGKDITIQQSHGGSSKQARAVIDGLEADVVTLALGYDIDALADKNLLPQDWIKRLPNNSAPYTSTVVFLVRKGNPKGIKDWDALIKQGVSVITPNPKTSGNGRLSYLGAWGYAWKKSSGDEASARDFIAKLYKNVPVLDSGARASTMTFVQREIGDVLITWENEAYLAVNEIGADKVEVVTPSVSILAEPPVTWVDKVVEKRGTTEVAKAYLEFLYSDEGQEIAGKHYYRPYNEKIGKKYIEKLGKVELFTLGEVFGDWRTTQKKHFDDGGIFDEIYKP